jgi:ABC-type nitrate/sulfonate/bicarbonate transport system ATPase subunit
MKQRVAIARVLAKEADVLLMDEPFGALDALTRGKLQEELLEIWQRMRSTIVFGDRVIAMSAARGRIDNDTVVTLPRPRDVSAAAFNALRRMIADRLTRHLKARIA